MDMDGTYLGTPYETTQKPYKYGSELNLIDAANEYEGFTVNPDKTKEMNPGYTGTVTGDVKLKSIMTETVIPSPWNTTTWIRQETIRTNRPWQKI